MVCVQTHAVGVAMMVFGDYEWDVDKADANVEKHGVSFVEAATALQDPNVVYVDASLPTEERFAAIGMSAGARLLYVVHVERRERERIISARLATASEEDLYARG
jgi:uncharacterized DUF497 family protein